MGEVFYKRVKGWFHHVQWPPATTWSPNQRGMSLLELYVDFMSFTNTEAPFNIGPKCVGNSRKSAQYVLLGEQPIYRGDGVPLATMIQTWQRFWKWVRQLDISVPRLDVDDKQPMAYALRAPFVRSRARPACGDKLSSPFGNTSINHRVVVDVWLPHLSCDWHHFRSQCGCAFCMLSLFCVFFS